MTIKNLEKLDAEIQDLMVRYFEALHTQDMSLFDQVFHKDCVLYGVVDGKLNIRPFDAYREAVMNRQSPQELGEARREEILDYDKISNTIAWVKPQLEMFGGVMQDYLNLVYLDGQWWVMAKMWQKVGDVA